jgi:hypothetical protein
MTMKSALPRVGAALLGAFLLVLSLLGSLGTALLVPLCVLVARQMAHRGGRQLTTLEDWSWGVLPFGVMAIVGLAAISLANSHQWLDKFESSIVQAQQHPPEQPAFLRQLGAPPPTPLPPGAAKVFGIVGMVFGVQVWSVVLGTMAWGGTSLFIYGAVGRRSPAVPSTDVSQP